MLLNERIKNPAGVRSLGLYAPRVSLLTAPELSRIFAVNSSGTTGMLQAASALAFSEK